MAELRIAPEMLLSLLFPDQDSVTLHGARFDPVRRLVIMDITGPTVPEVGEVVATVTVHSSRTTRFVPASGG